MRKCEQANVFYGAAHRQLVYRWVNGLWYYLVHQLARELSANMTAPLSSKIGAYPDNYRRAHRLVQQSSSQNENRNCFWNVSRT